jgi:hypothetical protein
VSDKAKIGAAVAGGYLLGRTKRGRLALGLAMLLAGYRPSTQLRKGLLQLTENAELGQLTSQLRGPLALAGRKAAEAVIAAQAARLTDQLSRRTEALSDSVKDAGQTGRDTVEGVGDTAEGAVRGVGKRARRGGSSEDNGAEPKRGRSRASRDQDEDETADEDAEYEDDEADRYEEDEADEDETAEEEPEEDEEPARPKVRVASRRRSG